MGVKVKDGVQSLIYVRKKEARSVIKPTEGAPVIMRQCHAWVDLSYRYRIFGVHAAPFRNGGNTDILSTSISGDKPLKKIYEEAKA